MRRIVPPNPNKHSPSAPFPSPLGRSLSAEGRPAPGAGPDARAAQGGPAEGRSRDRARPWTRTRGKMMSAASAARAAPDRRLHDQPRRSGLRPPDRGHGGGARRALGGPQLRRGAGLPGPARRRRRSSSWPWRSTPRTRPTCALVIDIIAAAKGARHQGHPDRRGRLARRAPPAPARGRRRVRPLPPPRGRARPRHQARDRAAAARRGPGPGARSGRPATARAW